MSTFHRINVENAHLLPTTERQYWKENGLHNCTLQPGPRTQGQETFTKSNLIRLEPTLHRMFDAGHFVLIPVNQRLRCLWIRTSNRMAVEFQSHQVQGGCHLISPEYAYLACVYRVMWLMQEDFLERGPVKTLVMTSEGQQLMITGLELGEYRQKQFRDTSPAKGGSRSASPRKRSRDTKHDPDESQTTEHEDFGSTSDSGVDVDQWVRGRQRTTDMEAMVRTDTRKKRRLEPHLHSESTRWTGVS